MIAKIGDWVKHHQYDLWVVVCVALTAWAAYNIGRIQAHDPQPISMQGGRIFQAGSAVPDSGAKGQGSKKKVVHTDLRVVVSKSSSSKKYHFSWCASASKIKPENQIWFATAQAAKAAGYTLAGNCTP